ncbi:cation-transporting P-type ATPase, partial [Candidatus Peregrinibacteria bacterium]|nr:cation-transporting P-type ATPase [Candidatus Peregrinibacteria bacterium]
TIEEVTTAFLKKCAIDNSQILKNYIVISKIPSSEHKKLSSVVVQNKEDNTIFAYSKGNPYNILEKCTRVYKNERNQELSNETRRKIKDRIKRLNKNGQKIIAFAYKPLPLKRFDHYSEEFTENDLVWVGMIGLSDNINKNMKEYIEEFKQMGIKIYILSETKERKAVAVGRDLKIINPQYFEAVTGEDLRDINGQKLHKMLANKEKDFVFCELKENQKEQIIEELKNAGEIIAYANKDESIKKILRGIQAAKREEMNSSRLFAHSLCSKIIQTIIVLSAMILRAPLPLTLGGILAIELLINFPLELSLRTEVVKRHCPSKKEIITSGTLYALLIGGIYYWSLIRFGWTPGGEILTDKAIGISTTLAFVLICLLQILRAQFFGHFSNPYLGATTIISLLIIYSLFNYLPATFGITNISGFEWSIIAFTLTSVLIIHLFYRYAIAKK